MTSSKLEKIKEKLAEIVGAENVGDDPKILEEYSWDHSFVPPRKPSYVVYPQSAGEIQRIVKFANERVMPLTPISSPGGPRFHGDTVPTLGGIVVDLSKMNKILRIDCRNKVTIIEPGVTFNQLRSELKEHGLRPYTPLLPRATKSVLASYLEREPIIMPREHWDVLDPLICVEVVFGTGDIFRTGEAAGPGTVKELMDAGLALVSPMGPGSFDPARIIQGAQGTIGIVTWANVFCQLLPKFQRPFFLLSETLGDLIEFTYRVLRRRLGEELFLLNSFALANIIAEEPEEIRELASTLPPWIVFFSIAGFERFPEEKVDYQEKDSEDIAQKFGLEILPAIEGISGGKVMELLENPPEKHWKLKHKGSCEDIFFLTTLDKTPQFVKAMREVVEAHGCPAADFGIYIQPIIQGVACHCEFNLMYDPSSAEEKEKIRKILRASENLINLGAFFSRPYGPWADVAYKRDAETAGVLRKVKDMFDPQGIMNPGKLCFEARG